MVKLLAYDNLEDASGKLANTFCYYDGKAVLVKSVHTSLDPPHGFVLDIRFPNGGKALLIPLTDPKFDCSKYNLGYSNKNGIALWWFRKPIKQYKQGLRSDQMSHKSSHPQYYGGFNWNWEKPMINTLENVYPKLESTEKALKDGDVQLQAFHKDFAVSYDSIHKDMIVEYHGVKIGSMLSPKKFTLTDDYTYLTEALTEVISVQG